MLHEFLYGFVNPITSRGTGDHRYARIDYSKNSTVPALRYLAALAIVTAASPSRSVECRIYAENPYQDFVPSTGTLVLWRPPTGHGLRLDSGVAQGDQVSTFYDPMLAKMITWGAGSPY